MSFINRLLDSSNTLANLETFIERNSIELYDFFIAQDYGSLLTHRATIENYVLPKYRIYKDLDYSKSKNQTFLFCLLDVSLRFGLSTEFRQVYNLAAKNSVPLNSRINATAKFHFDIKSIDDYENNINNILSLLAHSFLEEEDNEQKTIATLIHFYSEVFYNFSHNKERVIQFRAKLTEQLNKEEYKFLYKQSVKEVLSYSLDNIEELYQAAHAKIDEILERASRYLAFNKEPHLIESETHYAQLLADIGANFGAIRNLCVRLYKIVASDDIFWSLQRGVKVLTEQNQLLAYIHSYGNMHQAKMSSALKSIDSLDFQKEIEIYDWGCGQGLASICFLEHYQDADIKQSINKITLIEPSEIAIRRASLHLRKFAPNTKIVTTNKDLDSLQDSDFDTIPTSTKVHLFSNILDVDLFSMTELIQLINRNLPGDNIFICVSPFVSDIKTGRIDNFVQAFSQNSNFQIISAISERNGEWAGNSWSRIIRVFHCLI